MGNRIMEMTVITSLDFCDAPSPVWGFIDNTKLKRPFYLKYMVDLRGSGGPLFFILVQIFRPGSLQIHHDLCLPRGRPMGLGRGNPGALDALPGPEPLS
jgi:hypothetical protein